MSLGDLFQNASMNGFENLVILANLAGAMVACVVNFFASARGIPRMRRLHWLVGSLAGVYAIAYGILLVFDPVYLEWSSLMRGVAIFAWIIVWCAQGLVSYRIWRDFPIHLEAALQERLAEDSRGE